MPRTAREAFYKGPHRAAFEKLAATEAFDAAVEYAMLTFGEELADAQAKEPAFDWALFQSYVGARKVIDILRTLHLPQEIPKTEKYKSLKPPQ